MPKAHEPTPEIIAVVEALASIGTPNEEIAAYCGFSVETLRLYYGFIIETARTERAAKVVDFLYRGASGLALRDKVGATYADCARLAMFYGKTQLGMRETQRLDHTSSDGSMRPTKAVDPELVSALAEKLVD